MLLSTKISYRIREMSEKLLKKYFLLNLNEFTNCAQDFYHFDAYKHYNICVQSNWLPHLEINGIRTWVQF